MVNSDENSQSSQNVHGTRANMAYVLKTDLDEAINTAVSKIKDSLIDNLRPINHTLSRLESAVGKNTTELSKQGDEILLLKNENIQLKQINDDLTARVDNLETAPVCDHHQLPETNDNLAKELDQVKERLEERTNRQLRQTLVIKGVKELPREETWEQTKQLLASAISKNVNTTYKNAYAMLNRVHRSRPTQNHQKRGQRDIYANVYSWEHCDRLVNDFRMLNVRGESNIRIEFKYGPLTTNRRIQAMERRKVMKTAGDIVSGYVAYPARLMVKAIGHSKYSMIEDFSRVPFKEFKQSNSFPPAHTTAVQHGQEEIPQSGWSNPDNELR